MEPQTSLPCTWPPFQGHLWSREGTRPWKAGTSGWRFRAKPLGSHVPPGESGAEPSAAATVPVTVPPVSTAWVLGLGLTCSSLRAWQSGHTEGSRLLESR